VTNGSNILERCPFFTDEVTGQWLRRQINVPFIQPAKSLNFISTNSLLVEDGTKAPLIPKPATRHEPKPAPSTFCSHNLSLRSTLIFSSHLLVISEGLQLRLLYIFPPPSSMRVHPKVSGLDAWSEDCKWYSSLPLGAVVSLFCESVL
jgi:hypothetical protein